MMKLGMFCDPRAIALPIFLIIWLITLMAVLFLPPLGSPVYIIDNALPYNTHYIQFLLTDCRFMSVAPFL